MCPVLFWCFVIKNWLLKCYTCSHIDLLVCDYLNAKLQARETVGWGLGDWLGGWKCWKGDWVSSKQQRASGKQFWELDVGMFHKQSRMGSQNCSLITFFTTLECCCRFLFWLRWTGDRGFQSIDWCIPNQLVSFWDFFYRGLWKDWRGHCRYCRSFCRSEIQ